ncbi:hypothetical protein WMY93_000983 [Mugilogobius chulae]|uniref:Leucine-rich repeat-containing protein 42 n=1 Tax=Mugilogobius chulae TaxID=88201 RepID=A0AAW0Q415_9GOBI
MQLFNDAYGDLVLRSLCLRNSEIKTFHGLRTLDLFGCRLGDDHEIFQHLTSSLMTSLEQLYIGGNSISDMGLQKLTAPVRMMKKGLDSLNLWTFPVVNQWETSGTQMPKLKKLEESRTSALRFFGRQKFVRDVLNAAPVIHEKDSDAKETLHFYKAAAADINLKQDKQHASTTSEGVQPFLNTNKEEVNPSLNSNKKRLRQVDKCVNEGPPTKRSSAFTVEDMDLLNSY